MAENAIEIDPLADAIEADDSQDDNEVEIKIGEDEIDDKPEIVTMKPDELAVLRAQADTAKAVKEGIEGLASRMQMPQAQAPVNTPQQTPEEFYAEHSDDLFDKEKGAKVLAQYNKMVMEREFGPMIQGMSAKIGTLAKENLKLSDPLFKDYESEVDALVKQQPANVQSMPDVYERAWLTIREKHRGEIETKSIDAKVEERLNARLKELGIDSASARPPARINSDSRSVGAGPAPKSTIRFKTEEDRDHAVREAEKRGLSLSDYMRKKGAR
ncbi:MAG: hypothetical protein WC324_02140 [Candidatus Omnitrophota bacterium]|jgi:hypothetical protein